MAVAVLSHRLLVKSRGGNLVAAARERARTLAEVVNSIPFPCDSRPVSRYARRDPAREHAHERGSARRDWAFAVSFVLFFSPPGTRAPTSSTSSPGDGSFILISFVLTGRGLHRLEVSREGPDAVHRSEKFAVTVRIENRRWLLPVFVYPNRAARRPRSVGRIRRCAIPARRAAVVRMTEVFDKRGVHHVAPDRACQRLSIRTL